MTTTEEMKEALQQTLVLANALLNANEARVDIERMAQLARDETNRATVALQVHCESFRLKHFGPQ